MIRGLDSFQAQKVVDVLRQLCGEGNTVMVSIHQPRSSIYTLFDDILLLSDGRVMYHGPRTEASDYFAELGFPCPQDFNPSDFMVDLVSVDYGAP
ncbi:unnamed protein product, partial [Chrysoparadoxa australica]